MFLEPIYIPRALNTGTSPRQGDLFFILRSHIGTMCQPRPTQDKSGEGLETMQVNGPEG